jgi:hypothetical protein
MAGGTPGFDEQITIQNDPKSLRSKVDETEDMSFDCKSGIFAKTCFKRVSVTAFAACKVFVEVTNAPFSSWQRSLFIAMSGGTGSIVASFLHSDSLALISGVRLRYHATVFPSDDESLTGDS